MSIKISDLCIEKIENGEFYSKIPELYELKKFIENNDYHNNDSVFNHTMNALREYKKFLNNLNNNVKQYLFQKIENYKRGELLFLSILFHDIAKPETFCVNNDITSCPGHEKLGSKKVKKILERFDLSTEEKEIIKNTIKYHNKIHATLRNKNEIVLDKEIKDFKKHHKEIFVELVIVAIVDIRSNQLAENDEDNFIFRDTYFQKILTLM